MIKYIKGFLQYFNIKNNLVLLRRLSGQIYVSIIFYNKNYLLKEIESIVKPRKLIFRVNKKNKLISPTQIGFQKFKKRNKNYGLYFKPFNIFETFRQDRSKQTDTYLKIINFFKLKNSLSLGLNSI